MDLLRKKDEFIYIFATDDQALILKSERMKKYKSAILYLIIISTFLLLIYGIFRFGIPLEHGRIIVHNTQQNSNSMHSFIESFTQNIKHPFSILLLQIFTIIFFARTFGFLFNKIGQPTVIGEIVAGIVLGPSLLGHWFPDYMSFLFPPSSMSNLQFFSQLGLMLFMFVVGMELDLKEFKNKASDAIVISHAGIIIPFTLGMALACFLYSEFAPGFVGFLSFSLFMGISISITAFPVLARILQEKGLTKSKIGTLALTCAAADDVSAWCLLAIVIAVVKAGSILSSFFTILMAALFIILMLKFVRPFMKKLGEVYSNKETLSLNIVALLFGLLILSAFITETIGIHALFGAFIAGTIMPPSHQFRRILTEKVEHLALGLLLPLFFTFSGLRTQIGLLHNGHLWLTTLAITSIAILGKFGGVLATSKLLGNSWKESILLGTLMNTRGLVELVVLNIGYDLGVLSPELFVMLVLMALITTFMTGPVLELIQKFTKKDSEEKNLSEQQKFRIIVSFGNPQTSKKMLKIASMMARNDTKVTTEITALHVTPGTDINKFEAAEFEKESFKLVRAEANRLDIDLKTEYRVSNDVRQEILDAAAAGDYSLLLVGGSGQSVFEGTFLGKVIGLTAKALNPEKLISSLVKMGRKVSSSVLLDEQTKNFISQSPIPIGIFIDKEFSGTGSILCPLFSISDVFLLFYIKRFCRNTENEITLVDYNGIIESNSEIKEEVLRIKSQNGISLQIITKDDFTMYQLSKKKLLLLSFEGWKIMEKEEAILDHLESSLLLIRP